jgi:hypothetical protein
MASHRAPHASFGHSDEATRQFFQHSSAKRVNTDASVAAALKSQYPDLQLVIVPTWGIDLLSYASAGHASFTSIDQAGSDLPTSLIWKVYVAPSRRIDGSPGTLTQNVLFSKYLYKWRGAEFILYVVDGRDGTEPYPTVRNNYILTTDTAKADALVIAAGQWSNELQEEVWVWDRGMWQKSAELYQSILKASWDAVILDEGMKKALITDHQSFFDSRDTYARLRVPWKRGLIYHGPPGNGKTISIKAMMHSLYSRTEPVPALYVRSFSSVLWSSPCNPFLGMINSNKRHDASSSAVLSLASARSLPKPGSLPPATSSLRTSTRS